MIELRDLTNVDQFKLYLYEIIDLRTTDTIFEGFTFDGKIFSLSISAQINWSNLLLLPDSIYPLTIAAKDESIYVLELANRMNFYLGAVAAKNGALQAGVVLKQQVLGSTTIAELQIIKDSL